MRPQKIQRLEVEIKGVFLLLFSFFVVSFLFSSNSLTAASLAQESTEREVADNAPKASEANRLYQQGIQQYQANKSKAALQSWQQALSLYRAIKDQRGEATVLLVLGDGYEVLSRSDKAQVAQAIAYYEKALPIFQTILDHQSEAYALMGLGNVYLSLSKLEKAIGYYQRALPIFQKIPDHQSEATILNNLGYAHDRQSKYSEAIADYEQALPIFQRIPDRQGEASVSIGLGNAYESQAQYDKAVNSYKQALLISQQIGDRSGEAKALNGLGDVYQSLDQADQAIGYYKQALPLYQQLADRNGEAKVLNGLGNGYQSLDKFDQAIGYYKQALPLYQQLADRTGEAKVLNNLGVAYGFLSQVAKAIGYYKQALPLYQQLADRNGEAKVLNNLGYAHYRQSKYGEAIADYEQALPIFQKNRDRQSEGALLSNFGDLFAQCHEPDVAIVFYKQSVNVRETIRIDTRKLPHDSQVSYTQSVAGTYRTLADLLLAQGRVLEAQQVLELLKIQELKDFDPSVRAKVDNTGKTIALDPAEQTILGKHGSYIAFAQQLKQCEDRNESCKDLRQQRKQAQADYEQASQSFQQALRDRKATDAKNFIDTQNSLIVKAQEIIKAQPNTALIYTLITDDRLWIVLATQSEVLRSFEVKVSQKDLSAKVKEFRDLVKQCEHGTCTTDDTAAFQAVSQQLYTWLFPQDLQKELRGTQHLVFALDRVTRYIPMSALFDGQKYLIQNYTVATIVSADSTRSERLPAETKNTKILALGLSDAEPPDFPSPLPSVKGELDAIVQEEGIDRDTGSFPGRQFLNQQFTIDNLEQYLPNRQILHIATHGEFVGGTQEQSYIVLGNGIKLRIAEMLKIAGLPGVNLVVLSACQTALASRDADGIEISSVGNAFFVKGVKSVVASLWNVNDASTSLLMQQFYKNLAQGMTKSEALRQAQLTLLNDKTPIKTKSDRTVVQPERPNQSTRSDRPASGYAHPYYWAPFILIGNGL